MSNVMRFLLLPLCLFVLVSSTSPDKNYKNLKKHLKDNFSEIPAGMLIHDGESHAVNSFFIYKTELTVIDFMEFVYYLRQNEGALPEEVASVIKGLNGQEFMSEYFSHSAFRDYPVLNINRECAVLYCEWLGEMLSQNFGIERSKIKVNLPSKEQWIYAAKGGNDSNVYGWDGPYLRNANGQFLANFRKDISQESISYNEEKGTYEVLTDSHNSPHNLTSPVHSYEPNGYGLYNVSGNVAELVWDDGELVAMGGSYNSPGYDIRIDSQRRYTKPDVSTGFRPVVVISN